LISLRNPYLHKWSIHQTLLWIDQVFCYSNEYQITT